MKRLWISAALLLGLLVVSLVNASHIQTLSDHWVCQLEQAQRFVSAGEWELAQSLTHQTYEDWNRHHTYLHSALRHQDTDEISRGFRGVLRYLDIREVDQYTAANADLMTLLELLAEMEQPSLVNVL